MDQIQFVYKFFLLFLSPRGILQPLSTYDVRIRQHIYI